MQSPKINALHDEYKELIDFCRTNGQVSFEVSINDIYRKTLLLSAASYFEAVITQSILSFVDNASNRREISELVERKVVTRNYHTFFEWDGNNTNKFLVLFGEEFKTNARNAIRKEKLEENEKAFLSLGNERNKLVHLNYIEAPIDATFDEIYDKYTSALVFVEFIQNLLS